MKGFCSLKLDKTSVMLEVKLWCEVVAVVYETPYIDLKDLVKGYKPFSWKLVKLHINQNNIQYLEHLFTCVWD